MLGNLPLKCCSLTFPGSGVFISLSGAAFQVLLMLNKINKQQWPNLFEKVQVKTEGGMALQSEPELSKKRKAIRGHTRNSRVGYHKEGHSSTFFLVSVSFILSKSQGHPQELLQTDPEGCY